MAREHSLKAMVSFTIITTVFLASTSLVYAIDPNASTVPQNAKQETAAKAQKLQERIVRMEDQIARVNEELIAVREQNIQGLRQLRRLEQTLSTAR